MTTNVPELIAALGNGATEQIMSKVLSTCADSVLRADGKKSAKVTLSLTLSKMSDDNPDALKIDASLSFSRPTARGKATEEETRESIMYYTPQTGITDERPKIDEAAAHFQNGMPVGITSRGS